MSEITTITPLKNELILTDSDLSMVEELLIEGKTLTEIFTELKVLPISYLKFINYLKKNPEINKRISEARVYGVQTLIDKLLMIYNQNLEDKTLDPAVVVWTRDRATMVKWVASKISDLYSDKKEVNIGKQQNNIVISWLDNAELEKKYSDLEKQYNQDNKIIEG